MIHDLRETVLASQHSHFVFPAYGNYSFADIPNTILSLLGLDPGRAALHEDILAPIRQQKFKHILFLLIDGLGFDNWLKLALKYPFFQRVSDRGIVTSLTSVFPSTTSAALTSFSTGLTPQEHGLPEWNIYLKEIDDFILTLPFRRWNGKYRDELEDQGIEPAILFQGKTIFEKLAAAGIPSISFSSSQYSHSAYSKVSRRGSESVSFLTGSDLMVQVANKLNAAPMPTFFYVYWDGFDNLEHLYTPHSREADFELDNLSYMLCNQFLPYLEPTAREDTLLIVSADHGQTEIYSDKYTYLTDHPDLVATFAQSASGKRIMPTGGIRDVFLHIQPQKLAWAHDYVQELLKGKAEVWLTEDAFQRGLFGMFEILPMFRERVGNLLVLPYETQSVWGEYYPGGKRHISHMKGHHGGLTPQEMFIPFGAVKLSDLV